MAEKYAVGFIQVTHSRIPQGFGVARKPSFVLEGKPPAAWVYRIIHWASLVSCDTMISSEELALYRLGSKALEREIIDRAVAKLKAHPQYQEEAREEIIP